MTVLFLDYDGVLHPNDVYMQKGRGIELRAHGHNLFEHVETLAGVLEPHPYIRIVLSTSWVAALRSFSKTKCYLPEALQQRVTGSTWHSGVDRYEWDAMARYDQIASYVMRHRLTDWLAVDDDDAGWPHSERHHLVHTDSRYGLGDVSALADLTMKLGLLKSTVEESIVDDEKPIAQKSRIFRPVGF